MLDISDLVSRGSYYLCSENKGADKLREADLRLCFRIMQTVYFLMTRLILLNASTGSAMYLMYYTITPNQNWMSFSVR